jgi:hypothetical protein
MSKHETPMTRWYWQQVGGTLIEEFPAVARTETCGGRWVDGVIVLDGEHRIAQTSEVEINDKNIVVVQTKAARLGMSLMGQTLFSAQLMKRFQTRSISSVALCRANDSVLGPLLESYPNIKVVVCPNDF